MRSTDKRKSWDKNLAEIKQICSISSEIAIFYQLYKKVLAAAPRDLLLISKSFRLDNSMIEVSTSIDSPIFPETKDIVRAKLHLGGYYIVPIDKDLDGNLCTVISVSQASFGGSLPKSMLKKMSVKLIPTYIKALLDGLKNADLATDNNDTN